MTTFIVRGQGWQNKVQVDETLFDKYADAAFEAMTQGLEKFFNRDFSPCLEIPPNGEDDQEVGLGWIMLSWQEGYKDNPDKTIACLTECVLVNAGQYDLAEKAKIMRKNSLEN